MSGRHNNDEYSLRRSISNTLRNKSIFLKNGNSNSKNNTLKKFIPNIENLKVENKPKNEEANEIEECLNNKSIQELIKKTITFDLQEEKKRSNNHINNHKNEIIYPSQTIGETQDTKLNNIKVEQIRDNYDDEFLEKKQKDKKSIDIYELNNISKNIFYNKKCTSSDAHFLPLTLPFFTNNEKQKNIRKLLLNKETFLFYIQLPNMLPEVIQEGKNENGEEVKGPGREETRQGQEIKEELPKEEKLADESEEKGKIKKEKKFLENSRKGAYKLSSVKTLPNGKFAKLIIYKNKKIKMKINDILFDVNEGSECTFSQEIGCYIKENSEFIFLGNCDYKLVATPNIERIINKK
ncbi:DNA-directed RNA polymerase III subunit RPC4, putative [Plasmodium ovale]|uniref:DNA-directed RNA polymerase III subunit RPC4, putative n=2 Tax=Plasmodium ovale TaxID=36330 RepID=A0A1A8W0M1_PLAOA|nr:DNA-directed RNA polymerase III subunit RPC4, putative [Plasmodium ovale curtisi]SBS96845.1 DNA-directed RNA polymerase III subunit RPC4, putative [Plasmodium ovale curtisi]SCP05648.1 DNA-directed RNA polymerase III subunit RPC4, putative [Plasmodium ovale]